jgi:hypothetical protein
MVAILVIISISSLLIYIITIILLPFGKDTSLNRVIIVGFIINLSDYSFKSNFAVILYIVVTLVGVLSVRVLKYKNKLKSYTLLR